MLNSNPTLASLIPNSSDISFLLDHRFHVRYQVKIACRDITEIYITIRNISNIIPLEKGRFTIGFPRGKHLVKECFLTKQIHLFPTLLINIYIITCLFVSLFA